MVKLTELSSEALQKIIVDAQKTLQNGFYKELRALLDKYGFEPNEIDLKSLQNAPSMNVPSEKKTARDNRSQVQQKYWNSDRTLSWSGRGRPPKWVVEACDADNMTIEDFKKSEKYYNPRADR